MFNLNEFEIMAKPIKETPVLTGKDAERFAQAVANPKKGGARGCVACSSGV